MTKLGPTLPISEEIHKSKYRQEGEPFSGMVNRLASTLSDNDEHRHALTDILGDMRFLPAGRVQNAIGAVKRVTPWNCFVSGIISDDFGDIMEKAKEAGQTMRLGGGIGYDFSSLRPRGSLIKSLGSYSSGPVSFMDIYNAICGTISSAGHRRGAQMGVLRVDHPDIEEFIHAKRNEHKLTGFNISVGITDKFMEAVKNDTDFSFKWKGKTQGKVKARTLWDSIMRSTWDYAEPGVLFIDRINAWNNLYYCENIVATNPSLRKGTKVLTDSGIFPIEELDGKEFQVKNLNGKLSPAKCFLSGKDKQLYKIKLSTGMEYYCTPEHKWPLVTKNGIRKVETTEIKAGDRFPILKQSSLFNGSVGSYEDGFIIGWLYGDGWLTYRQEGSTQYGFIVSKEDESNGIKERIQSYLKNVTGETYNGSVSKTGTEFNVSHPKFKEHFSKFGVSKKEDGLPKIIWNKASEDFRKGLIDGLFSSDGHVAKPGRRITLTTKHLKLAADVSELLGFYGIRAHTKNSITKNAKFPNGKTYHKEYSRYDVCITNKPDLSHFKNVFNLSLKKKQQRLEQYEWSNRSTSNYVEVSEIILSEIKEDVWDISVYDDTHCFQLSHCITGNCGEQPLPPYGACLLGSFNLVKYVSLKEFTTKDGITVGPPGFNGDLFASDIKAVVRAMDNIIDEGIYPLPQQEEEGKSKRRMGLGVTGVANAIEKLGAPYGSEEFKRILEHILKVLRDIAYQTSVDLAKEKGAFPLYDKRYLEGKFIQTLPKDIQAGIYANGIRNSHLLSIAPTGTISLTADNISSGIEPVYTYEYDRIIQSFDGPVKESISDFGYREWGVRGRKADEISASEHVEVLCLSQKYVDSSVSKTCNVGANVSWEDFKSLYLQAYDGGAKGCTTFRASGMRKGIFEEKKTEEYVDDEDSVEEMPQACYFDDKGQKHCE